MSFEEELKGFKECKKHNCHYKQECPFCLAEKKEKEEKV